MLADVARLALDLMDPRRSGSAAVARTLDTASARMLYHTMNIFEYAADSARDLHPARTPPGEAGARSQPGGRPGSPPPVLGFGLAFRGHMAEALSVLGTDRLYLVSQIAALGAMPREQREAVFDPGFCWRAPPRPAEMVFALPWWARERDTTALGRAIDGGRSASQARCPQPGFSPRRLEPGALLPSATAPRHSASSCNCRTSRTTQASATGSATRRSVSSTTPAASMRRSPGSTGEIPSTPFPWDVVLLLERARATEGLGQPEAAAAIVHPGRRPVGPRRSGTATHRLRRSGRRRSPAPAGPTLRSG